MIIQENYSLKALNTFHFNIKCAYFAAPNSMTELTDLLSNPVAKKNEILILGGGSNILFTKDFSGLVIKPNFNKITVVDENEKSIWIESGAGVDWDLFVEWCVNRNYYGIENLSLIPGNVGSCPVQNIGAYGVEVKDVIANVNGLYIDTLEPFSLKNEDCNFGYRNSIFKEDLKNKVIITSVVFELKKQDTLKLEYGDVKAKVEEIGELNLLNIRKAIIEIRESKLPDHKELGNVGSFFKNPVVDNKTADKILNQYPNAPYYIVDEKHKKIPAGWMIEQCGWKGKIIAVHEKQALVLINKTGHATGAEILELATKIEKDVWDKFSVIIEKEVNVI